MRFTVAFLALASSALAQEVTITQPGIPSDIPSEIPIPGASESIPTDIQNPIPSLTSSLASEVTEAVSSIEEALTSSLFEHISSLEEVASGSGSAASSAREVLSSLASDAADITGGTSSEEDAAPRATGMVAIGALMGGAAVLANL